MQFYKITTRNLFREREGCLLPSLLTISFLLFPSLPSLFPRFFPPRSGPQIQLTDFGSSISAVHAAVHTRNAVFVFSIAYGMHVSFLTVVLGYGQLLALDESLTVLLAVS